jgi:hypothetical protein
MLDHFCRQSPKEQLPLTQTRQARIVHVQASEVNEPMGMDFGVTESVKTLDILKCTATLETLDEFCSRDQPKPAATLVAHKPTPS